MIVKTISLRKPLSRELAYKLIITANIVHTYFSLLTFYVHSQPIIHLLLAVVVAESCFLSS